jgi:hypothetical protein
MILVTKRRTLMQLVEKLIIIAQNDFKNELREVEDGSPKQQCCHTPNHKQTLFSKFDLINLVTAQGLQEMFQIYSKNLDSGVG